MIGFTGMSDEVKVSPDQTMEDIAREMPEGTIRVLCVINGNIMMVQTTRPFIKVEYALEVVLQFLKDGGDVRLAEQYGLVITNGRLTSGVELSEGKLLEMAEQQILGYSHRSHGYDIISLIESMGLTKKEWDMLKQGKNVTNYLSNFTIEEVNKHFSKK